MKKLVTFILSSYLNTVNLLFPGFGGKQAFFLFCYPMKSKLTESQQRFLTSAERSELIIDGKKVPLYKWGTGDKNVVFMHGWKSNTFRWNKYIESVDTSKYTIYSLDAPGHGNAQSKFGNVPAFTKSLKALFDKIHHVDTLIAHSIGSFASLYLLHSHPHLSVNKFVSLAGAGKAIDFIEVFKDALSVSQKTVDNMTRYFKEFTGHEVEYFDVSNFAPSIDSQALIVHDIDDRVVPVAYAHLLHSHWPDSELQITSGLGHSLKDDKLINQILDFMEKETIQELD